MNFKIRNLKNKDIEYILEWMLDPSINHYFKFDANDISKESVEMFIYNSIDSNNIHYAVVDEKDEYLGTVSLKNIEVKSKNAEYAISMRKIAHGSGAAKYASDSILRIAFDELKLHKVYLNVFEDNSRAINFYQKYGFKYEGVFRDHVYSHGSYRNLMWFSLLESEWIAK